MKEEKRWINRTLIIDSNSVTSKPDRQHRGLRIDQTQPRTQACLPKHLNSETRDQVYRAYLMRKYIGGLKKQIRIMPFFTGENKADKAHAADTLSK